MTTDKDSEEALMLVKAIADSIEKEAGWFDTAVDVALIEINRIRQEAKAELLNKNDRGALYDWIAPKLSIEERDTLDNLLFCAENKAAAHAIKWALKEAAERAVAYIDNNQNDFGEWDRVAFDDMRAAILSDSPNCQKNLDSCADHIPDAGKMADETKTCDPQSADVETVRKALMMLTAYDDTDDIVSEAIAALDRIAGKDNV